MSDRAKKKTVITRHEQGWQAETNSTGDILRFRRNGWRIVTENKNGVKFIAPDEAIIISRAKE